jgi:hypothetical protein
LASVSDWSGVFDRTRRVQTVWKSGESKVVNNG